MPPCHGDLNGRRKILLPKYNNRHRALSRLDKSIPIKLIFEGFSELGSGYRGLTGTELFQPLARNGLIILNAVPADNTFTYIWRHDYLLKVNIFTIRNDINNTQNLKDESL